MFVIGEIGRILLAALWRLDRREGMALHIDLLRVRLARLQERIRDAAEREEGLLFQFDKLLSEIRNEHRVDRSPMATIAAPMNRLCSMRRKTNVGIDTLIVEVGTPSLGEGR